jgi:hypothetical protein
VISLPESETLRSVCPECGASILIGVGAIAASHPDWLPTLRQLNEIEIDRAMDRNRVRRMHRQIARMWLGSTAIFLGCAVGMVGAADMVTKWIAVVGFTMAGFMALLGARYLTAIAEGRLDHD